VHQTTWISCSDYTLDTDLTDLANGPTTSGAHKSGGLVFTTSVCGKCLLVARDTLIYVYEIGGGLLVPLTSVVCPRRVLSMSMDVSSGRNAVAALLEGRMGMVCELHSGSTSQSESHVADRNRASFESIDVQSNNQAIRLQDTSDHRTYSENLINQTWNLNLQGPRQTATQIDDPTHICARHIPIDNGTSTFYRHLYVYIRKKLFNLTAARLPPVYI
jgi:hypothetical protein